MTTKRGFARKKDALQYEMDFKNKSQESSDITLNALAEKYLVDYNVNKKRSSYVNVRERIQRHIHYENMQHMLKYDFVAQNRLW